MMRRRPPPRPRTGRRNSDHCAPDFPAIGARALRRFHAERHLHPSCGAHAKSTGEPCRQTPAKGRTRCRFHGGATPRGDGPAGWHTPGFPNGLPTGKPRSDALKAWTRRKRRAETAAMPPEERARLEERRQAIKPGSATERARRRRNLDARRWLEEILREPGPAPTPERIELAALRAKAVAHLARIDAELAASADGEPPAGGFFD